MKISPYIRKVQYYETDQMAIVHHSNYIRWFEEARVDYMEQIGFGYKQAADKGIDFAVLGVECEYKSMSRFGDTVIIYMDISSLTSSKMTITYKVVDESSGQLRATGESRHCYYHNQKQRPISLKKELPELFDLFAEISGNNEQE